MIDENLENLKGISVITKRYENEFWSALQRLNVAMPDQIVRVSEHIPEIIQYI